ncbi:HAD family hydrolase [Glutamicibacter protophormiae]|uniref:HAD family hydrolase n=1 Tax=Glutamicibacter protophormiae TaxID=37930 RepID=UPI00195A8A1E|nr:HAD family phosphatase [Glutamicibacter protophormiae]QRQ77118.1 HAD family phosphatase [Glutamicibacter protophormiae]
MKQKLPSAVLWDMDGTLVDTEPYWFLAQRELLGRYSIKWTQEQAHALVGSALPDSAAFFRELGVPLPADELIGTLIGEVAARTRADIPWRPGARQLLQELNTLGVPCALVTMSRGPLAQVLLDALPPQTFDVVVTGEMVHRGKPDPEPYLLAVQRLRRMHGMPPEAARAMVAVEDSRPGVRSALAAGLCTVGVPNMVPLEASAGLVRWDSLAGRSAAQLGELVGRPVLAG